MAELGKNELDISVESTYDGMIAVNSSGIADLFNKAAERITGLNAKDVLRKPAVDVIPNKRLQIVLEEGIAEIGKRRIWAVPYRRPSMIPQFLEKYGKLSERLDMSIRSKTISESEAMRHPLRTVLKQAPLPYAKKWQRNIGRPES